MGPTFHVQWHITDVCNLRCRHCYQESYSSKADLTLERLKGVLENVRSFLHSERKRLVVDITGGEPFLHPDCEGLIRLLGSDACVKSVGVITNGTLLHSRHLDLLREIPEARIKLSAEAVEEGPFERFRGKGTWRGFLDAVDLLRGSSIERTLLFTLLEDNLGQTGRLLDFASRHRFDAVVVERFIPWGRGAQIRDRVLTPAGWRRAVRILLSECGFQEDDMSVVVPYRAFRITWKDGQPRLSGAPCIAGTDGLALMPDATVFPCRRFPLPIGNLRTDALAAVWKDSAVLCALRERKLLKGRCNLCTIEQCTGCRALAFALTGDYLAEDPLCFLEKGMEKGGAATGDF